MIKIFKFILFVSFLSIYAQASDWTGEAGDNLWDTPGNWSDGVPNGEDAVATIPIDANIVLNSNIALAQLITTQVGMGGAAATVTLTGTGTNAITFFDADPEINIVNGSLSNIDLDLVSVPDSNLTVSLYDSSEVALDSITTNETTPLMISYASTPRISYANLTLNDATIGGNFDLGYDIQMTFTGTNQIAGAATTTVRSQITCEENSNNTFGGLVDNFATLSFLGNSINHFNEITNNELGVMQFSGAAGGGPGSTNTFDAEITNKGLMLFSGIDDGGLGFSMNTFEADVDNTSFGQMVFYEDSSNIFVGDVTQESLAPIIFKDNSNNSFNSTVSASDFSVIYFKGNSANLFEDGLVADVNASIQFAGTSSNTFNSTLSSQDNSSMIFKGSSQNGFSGAITLLNDGAYHFTESSENTFAAGATIENSGSGALVFEGSSTNDFSDTITNALNGCIYFTGSSTNTFNVGATITNESADNEYAEGAIYFAGESVNTFGGAISNPATGAYYFINGNDAQTSTNTFNATVTNASTGVMFFQNQSLNTFNATVSNEGTLNFLENSSSSFDAALEGAGSINISGNAEVAFTEAGNIYSGDTLVSENAILDVSGAITASTIYVGNPNRSLRGGTLLTTGETSSLFSVSLIDSGFGTFKPAANETTTLTGDYVQEGGTLHVQLLTTAETTKLDLTAGSATLGGALYLELLDGYTGGDYTIIETTGGITGDFDSIRTSVRRVSATGNVAGNNYVVTLPVAVFLPQKIKRLKAPNRAVARQIVYSANNMRENRDAQRAINALARQSAIQFEKDLKQLRPIKNTLLSQAHFSRLSFSSLLKSQLETYKNIKILAGKSKQGTVSTPSTQSFIKSAFFCCNLSNKLSNKIELSQAVENKCVAFGWNCLLIDTIAMNQSFSCFESNYKSIHRGEVRQSTLSYAPTFGWIGNNSYLNCILMADFNQHQQNRRVEYANIKRIASASYFTIESSADIGGGYTFGLPKAFDVDIEASCMLAGKYNQPYQERGAGALNLFVRSTPQYQASSSLKLSTKKQYLIGHFLLNAQAFLEANTSMELNKSIILAQLDFAPKNSFFTITNKERQKRSLLSGLSLTLVKSKALEISSSALLKFGSQESVYELKGSLSWNF